MPAETQSAQSAKAHFDAALQDQQQLTPEEREAGHDRRVQAFLESCAAMSAEAERNGLTEEILAGILAEK